MHNDIAEGLFQWLSGLMLWAIVHAGKVEWFVQLASADFSTHKFS